MQTLEVGVFNLIDEIRALVTKRKYIVTLHARDRMDQRGISTEDLVNIIMNGEIIEDYPDSRPCPSSLVAGMVAGSHCHTVVALCRNHLRIITVYWPGDDEWIDHRMRRQS